MNIRNYICPECNKSNFINCEKKNCKVEIISSNLVSFSNSKTSKKTDYEDENSDIKYKNFLNWLFKTFKTNQKKFRVSLFKGMQLKKKQKILITGCGNGDDAVFLLKNFKKYNLKIYLQDLSYPMMLKTYKKLKKYRNVFFNISDARKLPFKSNFFDHTFHFGGINAFGNLKKSIEEMERVTKKFGSVSFGDESIAPWLRNTIYSDMLINNNSLWKYRINLKNLTLNAIDVNISYLLGNCFYFINYIYNPDYKKINYKIRHLSPRGGNILLRYIEKTGYDENYILNNLNSKIKKP